MADDPRDTKKLLTGREARTRRGIRENTLRMVEKQKPLKKARGVAKGWAKRSTRRK